MSACRRFVVAVLLVFAVAVLARAQAAIAPRSAEKAFAPGGRVWMDLSAGDYTIKAGKGDRVWVQWTTDDPDDIGQFKADISVEGRDVTVRTRGPKGTMRVIVEVPPRSDLTVRLGAGELRVSGIEGSKDLSSWAGDIGVDVGPPDSYGRVEARVTAGDLSAAPFGVRKSGFFRSFSWQGKGRYQLKVRLTAGNIVLR